MLERITFGTSTWIASSEVHWIDQSPHAEELSGFWLNDLARTFNFTIETSFGKALGAFQKASEKISQYSWGNPNSDPIGDLIEAQKLYEQAPRVDVWDACWPKHYFFSDEIRPLDSVPVLTPLDEYGRPMLDETGGILRPSRHDVCPRHGVDRVGGRCQRCQ